MTQAARVAEVIDTTADIIPLSVHGDAPIERRTGVVNIGKIPGAVRTIPTDGGQTISDLFVVIGIADLRGGEVIRNGERVSGDVLAEPGDTVFLVTKIRGN